jgi:hypothetical protein
MRKQRVEFFDEEQADELKKLALERIRRAAADGRLKGLPYLSFVLWRWNRWTEGTDEVKAWVRSQISTTDDAMWFLCTITQAMTSGSKIIRYVDISTVERFSEVARLEALTASLDLSSLDADRQRSLRGFRCAVRWKNEGKNFDYRGEYETGGNPLVEDR